MARPQRIGFYSKLEIPACIQGLTDFELGARVSKIHDRISITHALVFIIFSGCATLECLKLDLPDNYFDGVFANAALFHVPSQELPRVLLELHASLKPGGVLFSSNPHGHNEEGWNGGRYGVYYDLHTWRRHVSAAGFVELSHYYRPAGLPRERQPWLASVWRRSRSCVTNCRPTPSPTGVAQTGQHPLKQPGAPAS